MKKLQNLDKCDADFGAICDEFVDFYEGFQGVDDVTKQYLDDNLFSEKIDHSQNFPYLTYIIRNPGFILSATVTHTNDVLNVEIARLEKKLDECTVELVAVYAEFHKFYYDGIQAAAVTTRGDVEANLFSTYRPQNMPKFPHLIHNRHYTLTKTKQTVGITQFFGATSAANTLTTPEKFFYRWIYNYEPEAIIEAYKKTAGLTTLPTYRPITVGVPKGERVGTFIDNIWLNNYQKYIDVKMLETNNMLTRPVPTDDQIPSHLIFGQQMINPNSVDITTKISAEYMIVLLRETLRNIIIRVEMAIDKYDMKDYNYLSDPINHILKYLLNYNVISF